MPANDLRYMLYDTVVFGATANAESILFQVASGADATHNEQFTNMRGAGSLPQTEKMVVDKISCVIDKALAKADLYDIFNGSILEVRIADFTVIKGPFAKFIDASAYGGSVQVAAASDVFTVGLLGDGFELDHTIELPGGTPFKVRVLQGPAVTAGSNVKVVLGGIYTVQGMN